MSDWQPKEEWDSSWPYSWAWAYSKQHDRVHTWRLPQDDDGSLTHRQEFEQHFGHPASTRSGDQLGLASYTPPAYHEDGSLVAPPEIQIFPYYTLMPHDRVYEHFLSEYPDVLVRRAYIGPPIQKQAAAEFRWSWNEDGTTFGQVKRDARSWTGVAEIGPGTVLIHLDRPGIPGQGLAAVKAELAKQFPDSQIILPGSKNSWGTDVRLIHDDSTPQRRIAALAWANATFPEDRPEPKRGLLDRFKRKAADGPDLDGAMVALFIPEPVAKTLKVRGGEPIENMHITLAYFTDKAADRDDWDEVAKIVETIANQTPPLIGKIGGYGVFQNDDSPDVLWASPNLPGLEDLRQKVVEACEDAGFNVSDTHGFVPHVTIKYDFKGKLPRVNEENELAINQLSFARGTDKQHFDLTGDFIKETSWEMNEWKWPGTVRFVTDGKELLTEPEDQSEWQPSFLDGLQEKFHSFYPESKKTPASGWAIPTKDGMGYGVWAPKVGWGGDKELGLHDLINTLDRELKKPTHLVEDWGHIVDPKMYASTHPD